MIAVSRVFLDCRGSPKGPGVKITVPALAPQKPLTQLPKCKVGVLRRRVGKEEGIEGVTVISMFGNQSIRIPARMDTF